MEGGLEDKEQNNFITCDNDIVLREKTGNVKKRIMKTLKKRQVIIPKKIVENKDIVYNPVENIQFSKRYHKYDSEEWKKESIELYDYFIHNYDVMIEQNIKYLEIYGQNFGMIDCAREFQKNHVSSIQKHIVPWIEDELKSGELFKFTNWRPFPHCDPITYMLFGYRKFFIFNNHYLQLSIERDCIEMSIERDGVEVDYIQINENITRFVLVYYGFKNNRPVLSPGNYYKVPQGEYIEDERWNNYSL
jgi:hypothetical protein